jgi:hypothetical protein
LDPARFYFLPVEIQPNADLFHHRQATACRNAKITKSFPTHGMLKRSSSAKGFSARAGFPQALGEGSVECVYRDAEYDYENTHEPSMEPKCSIGVM